MSLEEALQRGTGRAIHTWWRNGSCFVQQQNDGTYLIAATTVAQGQNPHRYTGQRLANWEALVLRVAALPFACDPVAGWSPASPV